MDKPWKVIVAFVAVFMAGSVFGGFFALRIGRQVATQNRPGGMAAKPAAFAPPAGLQLLRRFADRLELTDEQREKLYPVVSRAEEQLGRIRQTSLEQTATILRRMQQEFRAVLTPPQIRALDRLQRIQNENLRREREQRQRAQNFGPGPQPGMPVRPGGQNRPFNQRKEGNWGAQNQHGPYGPPNRQYEGPPPGPRPEINRDQPGEPNHGPVGPPEDRRQGPVVPPEGEPRPAL